MGANKISIWGVEGGQAGSGQFEGVRVFVAVRRGLKRRGHKRFVGMASFNGKRLRGTSGTPGMDEVGAGEWKRG